MTSNGSLVTKRRTSSSRAFAKQLAKAEGKQPANVKDTRTYDGWDVRQQ